MTLGKRFLHDCIFFHAHESFSIETSIVLKFVVYVTSIGVIVTIYHWLPGVVERFVSFSDTRLDSGMVAIVTASLVPSSHPAFCCLPGNEAK